MNIQSSSANDCASGTSGPGCEVVLMLMTHPCRFWNWKEEGPGTGPAVKVGGA